MENPIVTNGRLIAFDINFYKSKVKISFRCSLALFTKPLRDLPSMFGLESVKEHYPYELVKPSNYRSYLPLELGAKYSKCSVEEFTKTC